MVNKTQNVVFDLNYEAERRINELDNIIQDLNREIKLTLIKCIENDNINYFEQIKELSDEIDTYIKKKENLEYFLKYQNGFLKITK